MKLWAEFDKKYFTLPLAQREKAILDNKNAIIEGLNRDFQKVYFGKKTDGTVVDLQVKKKKKLKIKKTKTKTKK